MKHFSKKDLELAVQQSKTFNEVPRKLGYGKGYGIVKKIKRLILEYNLDYTHFDPFWHAHKRELPRIEKICSVCKNQFEVLKGSAREKQYCSLNCSNSVNLGERRSTETNRKVSLKLSKPPLEKECEYCHKNFTTKKSHLRFCSGSCSSKRMWQDNEYRKNHVEKTKERVKNKEFGWTARTDLSFPEKIYKEFFEKNGFANRFQINHLIPRKEGCYFLDFYFPEIKLDVEIDGQQHERLDRKESDANRDAFLRAKGIKVVRIKWKSISKEEGKEFLKNQQDELLKLLTLDSLDR